MSISNLRTKNDFFVNVLERRKPLRRLMRILGQSTGLKAGVNENQSPIRTRKSAIENQFTHLPSSEMRIGSSSIMNWVLPMAPIMCVPVAAYHFLDISSPVWQPQLFA